MVTHQQYRAFPRNILHTRHQELVMNRKRRAQQLAEQCMRHGPKRPHRTCQAENTQNKEQVHAPKVQVLKRHHQKHVKSDNANVLHRIANRKHMACRTRLGIIQEHRKHRERIKPATETEQGKRNRIIRARNKRNNQNQGCSASRTQRNKAHFNKSLGHAHSVVRTNHQAHNRTHNRIVRLQILIEQRTRAEHFLHNEQQQENHDPEHGKANNRLAKRTVLPSLLELAAGKGKIIVAAPGELHFGIVGANRGQHKCKHHAQEFNTRNASNDRKHALHQMGKIQCLRSNLFKRNRSCRSRQKQTYEGNDSEPTGPVCQHAHAHQFLEVTALCRRSNRLQYKEEGRGSKHKRHTSHIRCNTKHSHRRDHQERGNAQHAFFRVLVRKIAGGRYKQHARQKNQEVQNYKRTVA